jgi:hypothetical protein
MLLVFGYLVRHIPIFLAGRSRPRPHQKEPAADPLHLKHVGLISPHFPSHSHDHFQFSPLGLMGQFVAVDCAGEATLWA